MSKSPEFHRCNAISLISFRKGMNKTFSREEMGMLLSLKFLVNICCYIWAICYTDVRCYRAAFAVANRACSEHWGSQHPLPPVNQPGSSVARRKMLKKATRKLDRDLWLAHWTAAYRQVLFTLNYDAAVQLRCIAFSVMRSLNRLHRVC